MRDMLGRLAALEALLGGLTSRAKSRRRRMANAGYVTFNRRMMYAALNWGVENYSSVVDVVRELCGGGVLQMPADASVLEHARLAEQFRMYWQTPHMDALSRMKLFKLAWDIIGPEFAGRHVQYEKFFPAPPSSCATIISAKHPGRNGMAWWTKFWHGCLRLARGRLRAPPNRLLA